MNAYETAEANAPSANNKPRPGVNARSTCKAAWLLGFDRRRMETWEGAQWYQRVQEVSSFSSIEKIWPISTLTFFTMQVRPLTSTSFAS